MSLKKSLIKQNQIIEKADETHKRLLKERNSIYFTITSDPWLHIMFSFLSSMRKAYREHSQPSGREGKQIKELNQFHIRRIRTVPVQRSTFFPVSQERQNTQTCA